MKKTNKKGFTIVELIIVIATIAVLAAVLIPTFANIINRANDSAYQQERTNQMIQDAVEKIEKGDGYLSWENLEEAIAKALAVQGDDDLANKIITIIKDKDSTGMTNEQLTAILEAIANKKFSDTQVKVILEKEGIESDIINQIIAKLPQVGITQEDIAAAVEEVLGKDNDLANTIKAAVAAAIANIPALNEGGIAAIVDQILSSITVFADVAVIKSGEETKLMTLVEFANAVNAGNSYDGYTIELLDDIDLSGVEWTPINGFAGTFDGNNKTLSNLKLNVVTGTDSSDEKHIGFFEKTENATIKNLTISGFEVYGTGRIASGALIGNASNGLTLSNIILTSSNKLTGKWSGGFVGKTTTTKDGTDYRDCKYTQ